MIIFEKMEQKLLKGVLLCEQSENILTCLTVNGNGAASCLSLL